MIVVFSTSCRLASVAILSESSVVWKGSEEAPQAASGACLRLLDRGLAESKINLSDVELFGADLGPGSFTGVRVGVTLTKTLAYSVGAKTFGVTAFDLVSRDATVILPNKRGEWFVREPGMAPILVTDIDGVVGVGYGTGVEEPSYPEAYRAVGLLESITAVDPEVLVPAYLVAPSISIPKKPFGGEIAR